MGGKRKAADKHWQRDPFVLSPVEQQMAPSQTREIMFALLAKDRKTALTPGRRSPSGDSVSAARA